MQSYNDNTVSNLKQLDLSNLNINDSDCINISSINVYNQKELYKLIYGGLFKTNNKNIEVIQLLISSLILNNSDILISGIPDHLIEKDVTQSFQVSFIAISGNYVIGSMCQTTIALSRSPLIIKKDLSDIIKNIDLSSYRTFELNQIDKNILLKKVIEFNMAAQKYENQLSISSIYPTYFIILANENCQDYKGSVVIKIKTNSCNNNSIITTAKASCAAYDSEQYDSKTVTFSYNFSIDKDQLANNFKYIDLNVNGEAWNNGNGTKSNIIGSLRYNLQSSFTKSQIYYDHYQGVNWIKEYAYLSYSWTSNNSIKIVLQSDVSSFATAWNAYWADGSMETWINKITLS